MTTPSVESTEKPRRGRWITGVALILLGVVTLVGQFVQLPSVGALFLPVLSLIFILWGIFSRSSGLFVPGGIIAGIGVGAYLTDALSLTEDGEAGVFLLSFGAGFALITLLSLVFTQEKHWWALIPGGVLAAIGAALLIGGTAIEVLETAGKFSPVILILIGLYVIFKRRG